MKLLTAAIAATLLSGCVSAPRDGSQRNLSYGLFYDFFRPESSKQAEERSKIDRPVSPNIDETYDVSKIRAPRQYSEVPEDFELSDWRDGVLVRADAPMLRKMKEDTASKVQNLERRVADLSKEPPSITRGLIEPVRQQLDVEKKKLEAIDAQLGKTQ